MGTRAALSNAASNSRTSLSTSTAAATAGPANSNNDTPVTGTALANVTAAVKARDSAVTVTSVRMDPDGSYDGFGTKAVANVNAGSHQGPQVHQHQHRRPEGLTPFV